MQLKTFQNREQIFRQGDESNCMYDLKRGKVGIFLNYGESDETMLATLEAGQFLGEMGLLDKAPRSAAAVSLEDGTELEIITEDDFNSFFEKNPDRILLMMGQMSARLRRITRSYAEACRTVRDTVETEKAGEEKSAQLKNRIEKTFASAEAAHFDMQG